MSYAVVIEGCVEQLQCSGKPELPGARVHRARGMGVGNQWCAL
jgi:hypothetical protein